jgi:hypothetical protein
MGQCRQNVRQDSEGRAGRQAVQTGSMKGSSDRRKSIQIGVKGSLDRSWGKQCRQGRVEGNADRPNGRNCRCGRQTMLKGVQKCRSDRQCGKAVQTGRAIREYNKTVKTERADRQHSNEGQADSADRANWVCGNQFGQGAGGVTVRTKQTDRGSADRT